MASIWKRAAQPNDAKGAAGAMPPAAAGRQFYNNVHSIIAGNGQHYVLPPRTGGQPWIGHKGKSPQEHPFAPAETFSHRTGGVNMPATSDLVATTAAAVTSITAITAGTHQLAPGGGVKNTPAPQRAPGMVGR